MPNNALRASAEISFGVRMVGTYIGHPEYIKAQLRDKLVELNMEKEHILGFPDPQIKNLMFRWCFCQKIYYLQRTTSPQLLVEFVTAFDRMKREIFCSLIKDVYTAGNIPQELWKRACLNIGDGGLGYRSVYDVSFSAYAASLIECSHSLDKTLPGFVQRLENIHTLHQPSELNVLKDFQDCLKFISEHNRGVEVSVEWIRDLVGKDRETAVAVDDFVVDKTLQALIGKQVRLNRAEEHLKFLLHKNDNDGIAWFKSVSGTYPGRWLQHAPKSNSTRLSPNEFTVMLFYRLRLEIPAIVPGSRCTGKGCGLVDPYGVHLSTGCGKGGYRHRTHDNLVLSVESMTRSCGILSRREARRCFQADASESQRRPDLLLYNVPKHDKPVVVDLMITGPVSTKALSRSAALQEFRAAELAYSRKQASYREIAPANNFDFVPVIFESTGNIHPETVKFLNSILEKSASGDKSRLGALKRFWYGALSFSLQKFLAQAILSRIADMNGRGTSHYNLAEAYIERAARESAHLHRE